MNIPASHDPEGKAWNPIDSQLRQILSRSPNIFMILSGPDMVIDFANEALFQSWNKDWGIVGKTLHTVLPELKDQPFLRLLQGVYTTGQAYYGQEEKAMIMRNGVPAEVYYNYTYQPVFDSHKAVSSIIVMATDITEQVETRKKVEESEQRFRALVTAASNVVYRMNPDWTEMRELSGKGFLSDTGQPSTDWLNKYIHPDDQPMVLDAIKNAVAGKSIFEMEHRVIRNDGTPGWTFSRATPILNASGEIIEWFGAANDITPRKKVEEALQVAMEESQVRKRLYETIMTNTPDLVYVFDLNYRFIYANTALLTMWGKPWELAIGRSLLENGYEPWHAEMHEREIDQVIATKQPVRGEVSFPHVTQGKRMYDYIFVPVLNELGEVEAIAGTTRDITEIKRAEAEIRESEADLQQKVIERTKELQRSNEDLQQFAHVASHDLKEPVRKIRLFTSMVKDESSVILPEKLTNYLSKIEKAAARMYGMIDGVLQYSSYRSIQQLFEQVDLNEIIKNVENDLEIIVQEKNARVLHEELPSVYGAPVLLNQLFYNLINNSLKFSDPSKPLRIEITQEMAGVHELQQLQLSPNKYYTKIILKDNGIGFDQEDADKIFQAFARLNSKDKVEGTGLGLALCRSIAERHNGAIYAEGQPGAGAKFTIILPLNADQI